MDPFAQRPEDLRRCRSQREVVDPPTLEDRQLALRDVEIGDLERVQRKAAAEVDERMPQPVLAQVPPAESAILES